MMEAKMVKGATGPVYMDALALRRQVFVEEQGIDPALEFGADEDFYTYFVGYEDETPVVTARTRRTEENTWTVQRVATAKESRRHGLAQELFEYIETQGRQAGVEKIRLHAQATAEPFYFAMNYERTGGPEMEAGLLHYWMEKKL